MSAAIEALEHFYAAINRDEVDAALRDFDPEVVRREFEGSPAGRTYRGIAELRECITKGRGTWAEGACDPERFLVNGDMVVVYLHARVRLKDSGEWVGGRFADGFAFRGGRIVEYHSFGARPEALAWAGIEDHETS